MTLLTPIPALIAGAATVPALLLLYFLKLRRRPVRVSSTLLWIQATRDLQVNVPFRWIRPTWLLVLQLLILALFLLALARPSLDMPGQAAAKTILLIDRSASMSARDAATGTRLQAAKARALRFVSELSRGAGGASVSVVSFAAEPAILSNFSADRAAASEAITSITPTDQPGNLGAAMRLAGAMMAGDTDESGPRRAGLVVLFSDGSFAGDESFTLAGAEFRFERIGPTPRLDLASEPPVGPDNLGIVALAARRDRDDPGSIRLFARVLNASRRETGAPLVLTLDGREIERRPIIMPAATEAPAQAAATLLLHARDGGIVELHIDRADALDTDNTAGLVLAPATKPRLLLVVPDRREDDKPPTHWVITNVLDEMELPYRVMPASAYEADAANKSLPRADLIIFDAVLPRPVPPVPSLSFGAGLPSPGLYVEGAASQNGYFISWRRTHALLRDVSLDSIYVSHALPMPQAVPAATGTLTELARGAAGPWIVELQQGAFRRILVAFDPADSTWPLNAGFPIFLAAAIDYLTLRADDHAGAMFTTGESAALDAPGIPGSLTLEGPSRIVVDSRADAGPINLGRLERAGVYRLTNSPDSAASTARSVAVNLLDETESALAVRDSVRVGGETVAAQVSTSGPRELWPWAMLAALVLLSIEWFLNAWLMRA